MSKGSVEHPSGPQSLSEGTDRGQAGVGSALSHENGPPFSTSSTHPAVVEVCIQPGIIKPVAIVYVVVVIDGVQYRARLSSVFFVDSCDRIDV